MQRADAWGADGSGSSPTSERHHRGHADLRSRGSGAAAAVCTAGPLIEVRLDRDNEQVLQTNLRLTFEAAARTQGALPSEDWSCSPFMTHGALRS